MKFYNLIMSKKDLRVELCCGLFAAEGLSLSSDPGNAVTIVCVYIRA